MHHHRTTPSGHLFRLLALFVALLSSLWGSPVQATDTPSLTPVWRPSGSLSTARSGHTATRLLTGKVLVVGGYDGSNFLASAELYDPATGNWSATGRLTEARIEHTATLLPDGTVLVVAGHTSMPLATAERYDPITETWSPAGRLTQARSRHTATLLADGTVLVVGGDVISRSFANVERYDPATGIWSARSDLPASRTDHTATLLPDGTVLVVSGMSYPTSWQSIPMKDALLYHPSTDTWSTTASPSEHHLRHTATLLRDGTILVTGGGVPAFGGNHNPTATSEIYNPLRGTWQEAGSLATAREYHAATLLPDGSVLVVGGSEASEDLASAERYDPTTGMWSSAGSMSLARGGWLAVTATLLADGNTLVVGSTTSTEIYGLYRVLLPFVSTPRS